MFQWTELSGSFSGLGGFGVLIDLLVWGPGAFGCQLWTGCFWCFNGLRSLGCFSEMDDSKYFSGPGVKGVKLTGWFKLLHCTWWYGSFPLNVRF